MYTVDPGYAVNPFPVGTSSTSPMQVGSGMVAMPTATPGPQQGQPQMVTVGSPPQVVMVPVSGSLAYPPPQGPTPVATPATMATVYQPPLVETPQSPGHGGYTRLTNEEVHYGVNYLLTCCLPMPGVHRRLVIVPGKAGDCE